MNILHIDEQSGWRGGEQQASYLIRGLAQRGHTVLLAGRPDGAFLAAHHGVDDAVRIPAAFRGEWDLATAWKLARAVRRHRVDILHAHTSHAHTHAYLAKRMAGRGLVVVSRRVDFVPRQDFLNRWKYRLPDHIIAISERIGDVMRAFGVPPAKLSVVHSCIDPARFDVEPLPRAALGVPDGVPLLGNVAALVGHKDQATLLDAMPAVLRELPDLHLVIAGEGELRGALETQIERLGIGHAVQLLGYRDDVPRLLRALDAFVMSSKEEGLGTSVLDAMVCGLPVAATAGGGIPEMVADGQTGLLVPVQDPPALAAAIVRLFRDRALARRLGDNAKAMVVDRFTVDRMVEGNLRVYEELLGAQGDSADTA
ncbi:MAG: glycosyltransferase [Candidatus Hydrogenedentes bacterium]|nr:glycosyltransferase [Candidatus Hydrogenedentota bacterium]